VFNNTNLCEKEIKMNINEETLIFCKNVKILRMREGLSVEQMAQRLETDIKTIEFLENNIIPEELGCDIIFKIYKEFGILPKDIFLR